MSYVSSIKILHLNLNSNQLGKNINNMKILSEILRHFRFLKILNLNLEYNGLGENEMNSKYLSDGLKSLHFLQLLNLNLQGKIYFFLIYFKFFKYYRK